MSSEIRELTKGEKKAIRGLVLNHCANHDSKLGCIVMDCKCYMLQKEYCSRSLCKCSCTVKYHKKIMSN